MGDQLRLKIEKAPWTRLALLSFCVLFGVLASARAEQTHDRNSGAVSSEGSHQAVSVDTRPQLFAVLCALDAAGFDSGVSTANETPGRVQLRRRMLALQG